MSCNRNRFAAVVMRLLLAFCASAANAAPLLPMSSQQFESWNALIGGTASCSASGSYDVKTFFWTQSGACNGTNLVPHDLSNPVALSTRASLAGRVDNSGNLLGGAFALFGAIPDFGLDWALLAAGSVIDVNYGQVVSDVPGAPFGGPNALIALDYVAAPLSNLGRVLLWEPFTTVNGWQAGGVPWSTSVGPTDFGQFSGSSFFFFDRQTFAVPEPHTLVLVAMALLALATAGRGRKQTSLIRRARPGRSGTV